MIGEVAWLPAELRISWFSAASVCFSPATQLNTTDLLSNLTISHFLSDPKWSTSVFQRCSKAIQGRYFQILFDRWLLCDKAKEGKASGRRMLYIFRVDTGSMMTLEMSLALETVAHLRKAVASTWSIPEDKQVYKCRSSDLILNQLAGLSENAFCTQISLVNLDEMIQRRD